MCMNKILHVDVNECAFGNGGCADTALTWEDHTDALATMVSSCKQMA